MSHESISIEELAARLGRDRRDVEKLANRGRIPGRKVGGVWQFHPTEIRHWLEHEMRGYSDTELAALEEGQRSEGTEEDTPILGRMSAETVQVPLQGRTKRSVIESMIEVAGRTWQIWEPATVLNAVLERERSSRPVSRTGSRSRTRAIPSPTCWANPSSRSAARSPAFLSGRRGDSSAISSSSSCAATRGRICTFWRGSAG